MPAKPGTGIRGTAKAPAAGSQLINALKKELAEKEILLSLNNDIASIRDKKEILKKINPKLKKLFNTEDIFICLLDKVNETLEPFLRTGSKKRIDHPGYENWMNSKFPVRDGFIDTILKAQKPVVFDLQEVCRRATAPGYIKISKAAGIAESLSKSIYHGDELLGVLTLWSEKKNFFTAHHMSLIEKIAAQVSVLITNILANDEIKTREKEKDILLTISREFTSVRKREELLPLLQKQFERFSFYSDIVIAKVDDNNKTFSGFVVNEETDRVGDPEYPEMKNAHHSFPDGVFDVALLSGKPVVFDVEKLAKQPEPLPYIKFIYDTGTVDMVGISLRDGYKAIGVLFLFAAQKKTFSELQLNLAQGIGNQLGTVVSNILANEKLKEQLEEINRYREQLEEEKQYLQEEVSSGYTYSDIIGNGPEMQKVFHQLSQVSFADSTVLILGETGTGKELVARAIHNSSPRREKMMVKVNCAAMPANLIESELFGHERGSFTGATEKRIGKFELANHGTLFLDEIGEMPAELQVKLLRAIQEREIERLGGKSTIKVDVRIIAATNRDLQKEVDDGRFRRDLYYRLNVFPVTLPALRERKRDIPVLVSHFINKYSKNTGKALKDVSGKVIKQLMAYDWPGNVRELEHLVERTLLTTTGKSIKEVRLPLNNKLEQKNALKDEYLKTHEENERDHIIRVLNKCNGKIFGPGGAADVLNLRASTLNSKIKKLGIKKNRLYS